MSFLSIFVGLTLLVIIFLGISAYNGLVGLNAQVSRAWANIDVILKQRFDEIPQLIQVIEQYASYEQKTLQKVIEARNTYGKAQNINEKISASNQLSSALGGLIALGEAYPDLKANQSFVQLQSRVSQLEGQIADRREVFNEAVTNFNTRIAQIPDVFFANMLGYSQRELYRPPQNETTVPSLKMNIG